MNRKRIRMLDNGITYDKLLEIAVVGLVVVMCVCFCAVMLVGSFELIVYMIKGD